MPDDLPDSWRKAEVYCAAAIATFTLVLAIVSIFQWNVSDKAANAAKKAAKASLRQASVADEAMRVNNRPYVQVGKSDKGNVADWITGKGIKTGVIVYFQNAGNTPALRFYVNGCIDGANPAHCDIAHLAPSWTVAKNSKGQATFGLTYLGGSIIGSRALIPAIIPNLYPEDIRSGLSDEVHHPFTITGDFEYYNVFDEYCCEPLLISWNGSKFTSDAASAFRNFECPLDTPNRRNVCRPRGEKIPTPKPQQGNADLSQPE